MYLKFVFIILNNVVLVIEPDSALLLGHEGIFFLNIRNTFMAKHTDAGSAFTSKWKRSSKAKWGKFD